MVRMREVQESLKILRQVVPKLRETVGQPIMDGKPAYAIRAPRAGDVYARVENPKGELGYYCKVDVKESNLDRYHIRAPSFINLTPMEIMSTNHKIADLVTILGSIDIVLGEVESVIAVVQYSVDNYLNTEYRIPNTKLCTEPEFSKAWPSP